MILRSWSAPCNLARSQQTLRDRQLIRRLTSSPSSPSSLAVVTDRRAQQPHYAQPQPRLQPASQPGAQHVRPSTDPANAFSIPKVLQHLSHPPVPIYPAWQASRPAARHPRARAAQDGFVPSIYPNQEAQVDEVLQQWEGGKNANGCPRFFRFALCRPSFITGRSLHIDQGGVFLRPDKWMFAIHGEYVETAREGQRAERWSATASRSTSSIIREDRYSAPSLRRQEG